EDVLQRSPLVYDVYVPEVPHIVGSRRALVPVHVGREVPGRGEEECAGRLKRIALLVGPEKRFLDDLVRRFPRAHEPADVAAQRVATLREELRKERVSCLAGHEGGGGVPMMTETLRS